MTIFLETFIESRRVQEVNCYLVFTFEPLHNLHLEMFKLVKECAVNYLTFDKLRTGGVQRERNLFAET